MFVTWHKIRVVILSIVFGCSSFPGYVHATERSSAFSSEDFFPGDNLNISTIQGYFNSEGYITYTASRPSVIYGWNYVMGISDFFYVSTHGTPDSLRVNDELSPSLRFTSSNVSNNDIKLAFLSACYSASINTSTNKNLCSTFVNKGTDTVLGYNNIVYTQYTRPFEQKFYDNFVINQYKASIAYSNAIAYIQGLYGNSSNIGSAAKIFGNTNLYVYD